MIQTKPAFLKILLAAFLLFSGLPAVFGAEATDLTTDLATNPVGISDTTPRFSWKIKPVPAVRGLIQTAYQIEVTHEGAALWNSGKVASAGQVLVDASGLTLNPLSQYEWRVKVWDGNGTEGPVSEPASFIMGPLTKENWFAQGAKWIQSPVPSDRGEAFADWMRFATFPFDPHNFKSQPPEVQQAAATHFQQFIDRDKQRIQPASLFRRTFAVTKTVKSAQLYITGLGYYRAYLNGKKIGDRVLAPSDSHFFAGVYYNAFDVTAGLQSGDNVLGAEVVDGRWQPAPGNESEDSYYQQPILLARLEIEYTDGTRDAVVTDENWRCGASPVVASSFWIGEAFDARKDPGPWQTAAADDTNWATAQAIPDALATRMGDLVWDPMPPEQITDEAHPVAVTQPAPGVVLYDAGQEFGGRVRFVFHGLQKGQVVAVRYGETNQWEHRAPLVWYPGFSNDQQRPGMIYFKGRGSWAAKFSDNVQVNGKTVSLSAPAFAYTDLFISNGDAEETWEPSFTYTGFRFFEVMGLSQPVPASDVTVYNLRTVPKTIGSLTTDNPKLNQIWDATEMTILRNFHSQLQDNNGAERNPENSNVAFVDLATAYRFDTYALWKKVCQDTVRKSAAYQFPITMATGLRGIQAGQTHSLSIADSFFYGTTPLDIVEFYNDARTARLEVPWQERVLQEAVHFNLWKGGGYGDHIAPSSLLDLPELHPNSSVFPSVTAWKEGAVAPMMMIHSGFVAKIARDQIALFQLLGLHDDAAKTQALVDGVIAEARKRFYDPSRQEWLPDLTTKQQLWLTLLWGNLDPKLDPRVLTKQIVDEIAQKTHGHQITGSRLTEPLLHFLSQDGQVDEAARLLLREDYPSWLEMIHHTHGSIMESWLDVTSWNQIEGLAAAAGNWYYRDLVGIAPSGEEPAFGRFTLDPVLPDAVGSFDFKYDSVRGLIASSFKKEGDGSATWNVTVPPNATAVVAVPATNADAITESGAPWKQASGIQPADPVNGRPTFLLGSGSYSFHFPLDESLLKRVGQP